MDPQASSLQPFGLQGLQQPLTLLSKALDSDPVARLLALVGQELDFRLIRSGPEGTLLESLAGVRIQAEGELPFPTETLLRVRVLAESRSAPRLQVLEARPPQEPELLSPLLKGEAQSLLTRLQAPEMPKSLEPLLRLFQSLQGEVPEVAFPSAESWQPLRTLPETVLKGVAQALGIPESTPPTERRLLVETWVRNQVGPRKPDPASLEPLLKGLLDRLSGEVSRPSQALHVWAQGGGASHLEGVPAEDLVRLRDVLGLPLNPPAEGPDPLDAWVLRIQADSGLPVLPALQLKEPLDAALLRRLPDPALNLLARALGFGMEAPGLPGLLPVENLGKGEAPVTGGMEGAVGPKLDLPKGLLAQIPEGTLRALVQSLGALPAEDGGVSRSILERGLVEQLLQPRPVGGRLLSAAVERAPDLPPLVRSVLLVAGEWVERKRNAKPSALPLAATVPAAPGQSPVARPESWERWIRSSLEVLSDPARSPAEAPFHLAQAREGTALFEVPLPWAPHSPLQIWLEEDGEGEGGFHAEAEKRVLISFAFSGTGQTRVGLAQSRSGLRVRIWAEHPARLLVHQESLQQELEALGRPVDLKILPLGSGAPDLRGVARGRGLEVLG